MQKLRQYADSRLIWVIYLIVLSVLFSKVYDRIFDKKVHLGGDNAGYYIYGKSISSGKGYVAIHDKDMPKANHFPPGYPLLIAGVMHTFSGKIDTIKSANGFYMWSALMVLFFLFRALTKNIHLSFIACLMALFNFHLLQYSTIMMSEIPYLLFSSISLLLFVLTDFEKPFYRNWQFLLFVLTMVFSFYIRTMGISLFVSFTLILLLQKRWRYASVLVIGFLLLVAPWQIRSHSLGGNSYVNQLFMKNPYRPELGKMQLKDWPERIELNLKRYLSLEITSSVWPIEIINYKETQKILKGENKTKPENGKKNTKKAAKNAAQVGGFTKSDVVPSDYIITALLLLLMAIGLARMKDHRLLLGLYLAGTFGILFLWPEAWFGVRFMLPLIPILLFLILNGITAIPHFIFQFLKKKEPWALAVIIPFLVFFPVYGKLNKRVEDLEMQAKGIYINKFKNYFDLASWSSKKLPGDAVVACRKGQLFYLYANRHVTGFKSTLDKEELIENLHRKGVTHVVLDQLGYSSTSRYLYPAIKRYPGKFKVIHQLKNPDTYLMKFNYDLGYTGQWKDDKRNGKGTYIWTNGMRYEGNWANSMRNGHGKFIWPNGQMFEGEWLNDKRNGHGKMLMPDKSIVEGFWKNDVLAGKVKLYNPKGIFVRTAVFKNNQEVK